VIVVIGSKVTVISFPYQIQKAMTLNLEKEMAQFATKNQRIAKMESVELQHDRRSIIEPSSFAMGAGG